MRAILVVFGSAQIWRRVRPIGATQGGGMPSSPVQCCNGVYQLRVWKAERGASVCTKEAKAPVCLASLLVAYRDADLGDSFQRRRGQNSPLLLLHRRRAGASTGGGGPSILSSKSWLPPPPPPCHPQCHTTSIDVCYRAERRDAGLSFMQRGSQTGCRYA